VATLRAAVEARANDASLRQIAREVGTTHEALRKFLRGAEPFAKTRQKLIRWYLSQAAAVELSSRADFELALAVLLRGLPDRAAQQTRSTLVRLLRDAYTAAKRPFPL
jgi:hypothetical protein